jgi:amidase
MSDLNFLSAVAMAEQIRRKELSPVELVEAHLEQIEKLNPRLNAFVQVDIAGARSQAKAAEQAVARGLVVGPLHGVPLSIKSSMDVRGMRCESGTKLRKGHIAEKDAPLVTRLRQAGAHGMGDR